MATFESPDGTRLAYHRFGDGDPLVCLPGGPMRASVYLGDLGGLAARRPLVRLDLRGTGDSAVPADPATYRCDRQVDDVEAFRRELGLGQLDLVAHSAGGTLSILYAARYPEHVRRLALLMPSPRVVNVPVADADRRELVEARRGEPWFPVAYAGFERIWSGEASEADWEAILPFTYGRWDAASQADAAAQEQQENADAAAGYYAEGAFDPAAVRAAIAGLTIPVLLIAGEVDVALPPKCAAEYAGLFPNAEFAIAPGAGHTPWLDDAEWLVDRLDAFFSAG